MWQKRDLFLNTITSPTWVGSLLFIPGVFLFWLGELAGEFFMSYFSFWLILVGLCWIHFGWEKLKIILFPLLMILAMFPPPHFIHNKLTVKLKLISSQIGVDLIQLYGLSAYREGNVIDLGFTKLQVVDACSGLRYLFPLLIMGILIAYFHKTAFWKKIILVISTVPLTIITNSLRIAFTGILYEIWGPKVAEGFFHGFSGWFIFMFGFSVLFIEAWILKKILREKKSFLTDSKKPKAEFDRPVGANPEKMEAGGKDLVDPKPSLKTGLASILRPPHFLFSVILLGSTLVLFQGIDFREKIPPNKSLSQFPLQIGDWTGRRVSMEKRFIDILDLSDYVIINYKNEFGRQINFYTAYYESQRKGESIHSPASCLPGSGWIFKEAGISEIPVIYKGNETMQVKRAYMLKNDFRELSYYWFPQRGRILTNAYQLKMYAFWDALTRQRTDGALVRLITPVYKDENLENAESRLMSFTKELVPVLDDFLPD
jgi:exosortase D (VPLPA-CTERM-specific)